MTWPVDIGVKPYWTSRDGSLVVYCGDCRELLPRFLPKSVDLVLTDPPYGHGERWQGGTWGAAPMYRDAEKWDSEPADIKAVFAATEIGRGAIVWGGNYFSMPPSRCYLAWRKSSRMDTLADFELAWTSFDRPSKEFTEARNPDGKREHPTQKPVALFAWCLQFPSDRVETVFDPFLGSGTTLVACRNLGRKGIGIEISEAYCKIAVRRLSNDPLLPLEAKP